VTLVDEILIRHLGQVEYALTQQAMRAFTSARGEETPDELWLLEHPPVYTLGHAGKRPAPDNGIPFVQADRGGDITYHGPGQVILYTLIDLARRGMKVSAFVRLLEQSVIELLDGRGTRRVGAPGVYVEGAKIAALGLRVRQGRAYHGLALNVSMDLSPFSAIDPCGYPGLAVTQTRELGYTADATVMGERLAGLLVEKIRHA
jgi:lipoyl(octanoyl) transferase